MAIMDVETNTKYSETFVKSPVCGALLLDGVFHLGYYYHSKSSLQFY